MVHQRLFRFYLLSLVFLECDSSSNGNNNPSPWPSYSYNSEDDRQRNDLTSREINNNDPRQQAYSSSPPYFNQEKSSSSNYVPIDYQFKSREIAQPPPGYDDDEIPKTISPNDKYSDEQKGDFDKGTASARRDAIARYMGNFRGRLTLRTSSALVGMAIGSFLGQSLFGTPRTVGIICSVCFVILTVFRGPYGELSKALGLTLIFVWQRTFRIRRRYPTWPHIKSSLGITPRRPFPRNDDYQTGEVSKIYTLIAMALVGSTCGGSLPLLPTWIGGLGGAGLFVTGSLLPSARGDLCRSMGMRVVAVVEELLDINQELKVVQKSGVVAGLILDKMLILDRKHKIKDRIGTGLSWIYNQVAQTAGQVDRERRDNRRGNPERKDSDSQFDSEREQDRRSYKSERKSDGRRVPEDRYRDMDRRRQSGSQDSNIHQQRSAEPRYRDLDRRRPDDDSRYSNIPRQENRQNYPMPDDYYRPDDRR